MSLFSVKPFRLKHRTCQAVIFIHEADFAKLNMEPLPLSFIQHTATINSSPNCERFSDNCYCTPANRNTAHRQLSRFDDVDKMYSNPIDCSCVRIL